MQFQLYTSCRYRKSTHTAGGGGGCDGGVGWGPGCIVRSCLLMNLDWGMEK